MKVEQIHLAGEVRTGERDERVSKGVWRLEYREGITQGRGFEGTYRRLWKGIAMPDSVRWQSSRFEVSAESILSHG